MNQPQNDINLASGEYWDEGYEKFELAPMPDKYSTVKLLYQYLGQPKQGEGKSVFEIGVYPGRFIYHFGKAGYELNGIDQTKFLPQLEAWLKNNHFKTGRFRQDDVFTIGRDEKYDVVFSAGFIEHFTNFEELVQLHADITRPGGYVYITAPNFRGRIQNWLHRTLDDQNLARHYVPSMNVAKWAAVLERNGFEILQADYVGGFDFWVDDQPRNWKQKLLLKLVRFSLKILKKLPLPNSESYSPECAVIARRKS